MNDEQRSMVIGREHAYRDSSGDVGFDGDVALAATLEPGGHLSDRAAAPAERRSDDRAEWPDPRLDPRRLGVVEFLRRDQSSLSQHALDCIGSLNRTTRFRVTAHLQELLRRLALLVGAAAVASYVLSLNAYEVIAVAGLLWVATAAWTLLDCLTNTFTIANGRIRWGRGVLDKHFEALDVWTVGDIDLGRNALQRLTGDGTLILNGTRQPRQLRLTGVARGQELERVYVSLLYLNFLLRAHPGLEDRLGDSRPRRT